MPDTIIWHIMWLKEGAPRGGIATRCEADRYAIELPYPGLPCAQAGHHIGQYLRAAARNPSRRAAAFTGSRGKPNPDPRSNDAIGARGLRQDAPTARHLRGAQDQEGDRRDDPGLGGAPNPYPPPHHPPPLLPP